MVGIIILHYNIIILWDHRRLCRPSLTETSLCGAYVYCISSTMMSSGQFTEHISVYSPTEIIQVPTGMEVFYRQDCKLIRSRKNCRNYYRKKNLST